jgi:DNA-binding NtrC family response regulator
MSTSLFQPACRPARAASYPESNPPLPLPEILGESAVMQRLLQQLRRLGPHFRTVLLRGETGTGKELVARTLHSYSSHAAGPFVIYNRALQAEHGVASTASGANFPVAEEDIAGLMKRAHRGTVLLDQIGELSAASQADVLAVLQRTERQRRRPIVVHGLEARIIATTTSDLRVLAASGRFREELYYRMATVEIELPPLRDRAEDIPLLAEYFIDRYAHRYGRHIEGLTTGALEQMQAYRWPGNVRELKNCIRRAVMESDGCWIEAEHMPIPAETPKREGYVAQSSTGRLQEVVEQHVFQVLRECAGNKVRAAEMLGISRSTLYRMLEGGLQGDAAG